jgi:hypothetical protein
MSQTISRKSILWKTYLTFKEGNNIEDPSFILHVMCGLRLICSILSPYFYCVTNTVRTTFLIIFLDCKCQLLYVNYFICSPHNILLLNTFQNFMKIFMNLEACCFNPLPIDFVYFSFPDLNIEPFIKRLSDLQFLIQKLDYQQ